MLSLPPCKTGEPWVYYGNKRRLCIIRWERESLKENHTMCVWYSRHIRTANAPKEGGVRAFRSVSQAIRVLFRCEARAQYERGAPPASRRSSVSVRVILHEKQLPRRVQYS